LHWNCSRDHDWDKTECPKERRHGRKFRLGDNGRVKIAVMKSFRNEIDFELIRIREVGQS
jgi:hypothetical protein